MLRQCVEQWMGAAVQRRPTGCCGNEHRRGLFPPATELLKEITRSTWESASLLPRRPDRTSANLP
jgi:hypothetical protein